MTMPESPSVPGDADGRRVVGDHSAEASSGRRSLGIAVVGCGRISSSHVDGIRASREPARLAAVVDTDGDRAHRAGEIYGVPSYTSVREALAAPDVDAIVVCTPHTDHAASAVAAAEHGCHALVEKPFALRAEDARQMVEACEAAGVTLMAAQTRRYYAAVQAAWERRAEIGRITHVIYHFTTRFDPSSVPPWWRSPDLTGGLILPLMGSHTIDLTTWFLGQAPAEVFARGSSSTRSGGVFDNCGLLLSFGDGVIATHALSLTAGDYRHECTMIGSEGVIRISHPSPGAILGADETRVLINGEELFGDPEAPHPFGMQIEEFVRSARTGRSPLSPGGDAAVQVAVLEAGQKSLRLGQAVRVETGGSNTPDGGAITRLEEMPEVQNEQDAG